MPETREIAAKITADHSVFRRQLRQAGAEGRRFGSQMETVGRRIRRSWRDLGLGRVSGQVKALTMQIGGLVGVYGISQGIRRVRDFESALGDMVIQAGKSNKFLEYTRNQILKTSSKWGIMKDQVASFATTLVGFTGDLDGSLKLLDAMGMVATGTGASMESLGATVWQFQKNLNITGTDKMLRMMSILRGMESVGPFMFKDFARLGGRAFGQLGAFGKFGQGERGLRAAGGLLEIAVPGVGGDKAMAATAVQTFLKQLFLKEKEIGKVIGAPVMGRDLVKVFMDISKAMQDTKKRKKLSEYFAEGRIVAGQLGKAYGPKWEERAGKFFGAKADPTLLERQAKQRLEQPAMKWKKTMADLDNAMHKHLLPVMKKLVEIMPKLAKGLKWAMENARTLLNVWLGFKAAGVIHTFTKFIRNLTASRGAMGGVGVGGIVGGRGGRGGPVVLGPHGRPMGGPRGTRRPKLGRLARLASTAGALAGPVGWLAATAIEGPQLVQLINKLTGGPDIGMPILGGHGVFEARGAGKIRAGDVPGLTKHEKKKWDDLEDAFMKQTLASVSNIGDETETRRYLQSIDLKKTYKRGGRRGVDRKLQEMLHRRMAAIRGARKAPGMAKASEEEIAKVFPAIKELNAAITKWKAASEAFAQGKKFIIKVETGAAEKRTKQRATGTR